MNQATGRLPPFRQILLRAGAAAALMAGLAMGAGKWRGVRRPGGRTRVTWVGRKLDYTYMGFTAKYSCDGLRDTVREVLLALGARKDDLEIRSRAAAP